MLKGWRKDAENMKSFRKLVCFYLALVTLPGCSTVVAVADTAGSASIYAGKTVINVIDAVTPDIVNKD